MHIAGIIPEDAPDPAIEAWARLRSFPAPIIGLTAQPSADLLPIPSTMAVGDGVAVRIDAADVKGVRLDTDPFVFGLGADLGERGVFTAVLPRDELPFIELAFRSYTVDELAAST